VRALRDEGYSEIRYVSGESSAIIPLSTLYAQFMDGETVVDVDTYEIRLWNLRSEALVAYTDAVDSTYTLNTNPVHFEMLINLVPTDENPSPEPRDVLSLMQGITLRLFPTDETDTALTDYMVLAASSVYDKPTDTLEQLASTEPIAFEEMPLDESEYGEGTFFAAVTPRMGGDYAIGQPLPETEDETLSTDFEEDSFEEDALEEDTLKEEPSEDGTQV
jgi:hypothetical protein